MEYRPSPFGNILGYPLATPNVRPTVSRGWMSLSLHFGNMVSLFCCLMVFLCIQALYLQGQTDTDSTQDPM